MVWLMTFGVNEVKAYDMSCLEDGVIDWDRVFHHGIDNTDLLHLKMPNNSEYAFIVTDINGNRIEPQFSRYIHTYHKLKLSQAALEYIKDGD